MLYKALNLEKIPTNKEFLKKQDHKGYHYNHNSFQEYLLPYKTWKEEKAFFVGFLDIASVTWEGLYPLPMKI